jgi:hypothetical protein
VKTWESMYKPVELPAPAGQRADSGSTIPAEQGFVTLRWSTEHALEALESAGMTLTQLLAKHAAPQLEATKTIYFQHRGRVTMKCEVPDHYAQLDMMALLLKVLGVYSTE